MLFVGEESLALLTHTHARMHAHTHTHTHTHHTHAQPVTIIQFVNYGNSRTVEAVLQPTHMLDFHV